MLKRTLLTLALIAVLILAACGGGPTAAPEEPAGEQPAGEQPSEEQPSGELPSTGGVNELNILWAQWAPADYLAQIAAMYEQATGVKVNVIQEPWGSFGDRFFTEMAAKGTAWDMVIGDSQWLGQGATQGHYVELTEFMKENNIHTSVTPATLEYYGEYPAGSGRYWAYPTEGDADGWAYRTDLFEDPDEQAAFQEQYGYELAVPTTYAQLMDIAKFFTRPDENIYGVAIYTQKDYDAITMGYENMMFSWGARWQNVDTNEVLGVVNSAEAVESLEYYKELYDCCQAPGLSNAFYTETNDAYISGQAAMVMNYFAFLPALANSGTNPNYADKTGYFANPEGPSGQRAAALGGQGISIIAYIDPERQEASKEFIKWFAQDDIQMEWAELGGYTCNATVLQSEAFLNATPFNPAFAETMNFVMDFWNIPEYSQLLEVTQRELHRYVVEGQGTAQEALDNIANEHDGILREAGYYE